MTGPLVGILRRRPSQVPRSPTAFADASNSSFVAASFRHSIRHTSGTGNGGFLGRENKTIVPVSAEEELKHLEGLENHLWEGYEVS